MKRVFLVDRNAPLVRAWQEVFRDVPEIEPRLGDYFDTAADAMVSAANSFGIMDGGIDAAIRDALGFEVARRVRFAIEQRHHGELPIGSAEVVATDHSRWPFLIVAPTMRVPEDVSRTVHAYWAFRAVLLAIRRHNQSADSPIRSLNWSGASVGAWSHRRPQGAVAAGGQIARVGLAIRAAHRRSGISGGAFFRSARA